LPPLDDLGALLEQSPQLPMDVADTEGDGEVLEGDGEAAAAHPEEAENVITATGHDAVDAPLQSPELQESPEAAGEEKVST